MFAVMFLSVVILVITVALALLALVVRRNLTQIEALEFCVLHLLTAEKEENKKPVVGVFPKPFDSELYATPARYLLNQADVDAFKDKDGNLVPAWQTYMDKFWTAQPQKQANTYNINIDTELTTEELVKKLTNLFESMPKKEADQLADVIKLHGDKIVDKEGEEG